MKRAFLLLTICLMTAGLGKVWGVVTPMAPPYKPCFTDISYDKNTKKLSFNDTYKPDEAIDRLYSIEFYYRTDNSQLIRVTEAGQVYTYGMCDYMGEYYQITSIADPDKHAQLVKEFVALKSKGATRVIDISEQIAKCLEAGENRLFIAIKGVEQPSGEPFEAVQSGYKKARGTHMNNNISVNLTNFVDAKFAIRPTYVIFGDEYIYNLYFKGGDKAYYRIEYYSPKGFWTSIFEGYFELWEAREGCTKTFYRDFNTTGRYAEERFRARIEDPVTHDELMLDTITMHFQYIWKDGKDTKFRQPGDTIIYPYPPKCMEYEVQSEMVCTRKDTKRGVEYIMPRCNVEIFTVPKKQTITFLNADYTVLKKAELNCGDDATSLAPANPTYSTYTFKGWNKDITKVDRDLTVVATYDIGDTYSIDAAIKIHKNERYPYAGFEQSKTRAMVGDQITFTTDVTAGSNASVYYETATWNATQKEWLWNGGTKLADYTTPNQTIEFEKELDICYFPSSSTIPPFEHKMAVRFYMIIAGVKVYSDPIELDIYYPIYVASLIKESETVHGDPIYETITYENTDGDFGMSAYNDMLPARYDDTIRIYRTDEDEDGGCVSFARVKKPQPAYAVTSGVDENNIAYFLCPGEEETINVTAKQVMVVFDNAEPSKVWDFTSEGFTYKPKAYYAEVVNCGGGITTDVIDPEMEGYDFKGWKAWSDEYADDAYEKVPALTDNIIGFTAQWEEQVIVVYYTVTFKNWDEAVLAIESIQDGGDAVPPTVPAREGYQFTDWDGDYTNVKDNIVLTAQFKELTSIEQVVVPQKQAQKILLNGALYIATPKGNIYDALGRKVK